MPIYEYQCPSCGFRTEQLAASSSDNAPKCSKCGTKTERQFSTFCASVSDSCCCSGNNSGHSCSSGNCSCH